MQNTIQYQRWTGRARRYVARQGESNAN